MSESTSHRIIHKCRCLHVRAREEPLASHRWLGFCFFSFIIWRVRNCVRIGIICNYAPDNELDENGNPTLHFQRDADGNFYNATMRNLFRTMQTTTRVRAPDRDDWEKLRHLIEYLR